MPSFGLSPARAEASRRNGARSRGPKTTHGKTRAAQNALKHGFCAQRYVVLPDEDGEEFAALEAALIAELAPAGVLQTALAQRVVAATWRLARAERLEAELFCEHRRDGVGLGLALIRDGHRARSFDTLLRYRGGTLAEFWRALRTLKALQAEAGTDADALEEAAPALTKKRNEPECLGIAGDSAGFEPWPGLPIPPGGLAALPPWQGVPHTLLDGSALARPAQGPGRTPSARPG